MANRFLAWLQDNVLGRWWAKYFLFPAIETAPAAVVALWVALGNKTFWAKGDFKGYDTAWLILVAAALGGIVGGIRGALTHKGQQLVAKLVAERENLLRLIGHVRVIVNAKSVRFHDTLQRNPNMRPEDAFLTITQPQEQIKEIVRNAHDYFFHSPEVHTPETGSVCLMKWDDAGRHLVFDACFPYDTGPRTSATEFGDSSTLAGRAFFDRDMAISSDLRNDSRYKQLSDARDGSMFAYPVWDDFTHRVEFVINVVSSRIGRFEEADREALKIPMRVFGERLLLENRLLELRRRATSN
jgi:hypothetical protein